MLKRLLQNTFQFLNKNKSLLGVVVLLWILFFSFHTSKLKVDNSLKVWFTENDPALTSYYSFLDQFGSDEVIVMVLIDSTPYFDSLRISKMAELTHSIEKIEGIATVRSISNTSLSYSSKKITVEEFASKGLSQNRTQYLRNRMENSGINALYLGNNEYTTILYAWIDTIQNIDIRRKEIIDEIQYLAKGSLVSETSKLHLGGVGVLFDALNRTTINEGLILIALSYLILIISILIATRSKIITIATILVVTFSSITMFGCLGLFGRSINMVTLALPPLLMVISVSNIIHITQYLRYSYKYEKSKKFFFINALTIIALPILFNAFTTASGFLSLSTASMAITKDYGLFAAIGILSVLFFSFIASIYLGQNHFINSKQSNRNEVLSVWLEHIFLFSIRNKLYVVLFSILFVIVSVNGILKIDTDTYTMGFLPEKHKVRQDDIAIQNAIGSYIPFEFSITLNDKNWRNAKLINALVDLQTTLEQEKDIASSFSIANIVFEANNKWPISQQKLMLLSNRISKDSVFNQLISNKGKTIRLTLNVPMLTAKQFDEMAARILTIAQPELAKFGTISKGGYLPLYSSIISKTLSDQIKSLTLAFIIIMFLMLILLKSPKFTLLAVPSNILPILFVLSYMGFVGMRLDIATITVAATVLGIIVDDSIHILYHLKSSLKEGCSIESAFSQISKKAGKSVLISSIIIVAGYSIVAIGNVKLISNTSWLMILAIVFALITDLCLLPALAAYFFKKAN